MSINYILLSTIWRKKMKLELLKKFDGKKVKIRTRSKRSFNVGILHVDVEQKLITYETEEGTNFILPSDITEIFTLKDIKKLEGEG